MKVDGRILDRKEPQANDLGLFLESRLMVRKSVLDPTNSTSELAHPYIWVNLSDTPRYGCAKSEKCFSRFADRLPDGGPKEKPASEFHSPNLLMSIIGTNPLSLSRSKGIGQTPQRLSKGTSLFQPRVAVGSASIGTSASKGSVLIELIIW